MTKTATVTSKGQVTIPKEVRDRLGLRAGDEIAFEEQPGGYRVTKQRAPSKLARWRGYAKEFAGRTSDELLEDWRGR